MPELPEVETIRRGLIPLIGGAITAVDIRRRDVIDGLTGNDEADQHRLLAGSAIVGLHRHGKQLAVEGASARVVLVQLGMSGQLRLESRVAAIPTHAHVVWSLAGGRRVVFRDPRRFGGITLVESIAVLRSRWNVLGPDALGITADALRGACAGTRRSIKSVLLDQNAVAGVGNIYADEALFLAGMRPTRGASRVSGERLERLAEAIRSVLAAGIEGGGSTVRDYAGVGGETGSAQDAHRVYGRGGLPCVRCRVVLRKVTLAQRTTVYCPDCQV